MANYYEAILKHYFYVIVEYNDTNFEDLKMNSKREADSLIDKNLRNS
jgi:hypothetical protein